ncbi:SpoIIE family protein phosphatase [Streptomyces sp. NPDC001070]
MSSGDVLALVDEGGRVIEWGPSAEEVFGWSAKEAVGRSVITLVREAAGAADALVKPVLRGTSLTWQVLPAGEGPAARDAAILDAVFSHSPVTLYVLDDRLRIVRASTGAGALHDVPAGELLGSSFTEVWSFDDPEEETAVARGVLASGEAALNRLARGRRAPGRTGHPVHALSYFRVQDSRGDVLGLMAAAVDVTERERARKYRAVLERVHTRVGHRLSVMDVCWELVEAVVPAFAGTTVVEVLEDVVRGDDPPLAPLRSGVPLRQAAFRGRFPAHSVGSVRPLLAGSLSSRVLSDLKARLVPWEDDGAWTASGPIQADDIGRSGARSLIVAPLALRGRALGVVCFYRHKDEVPFEEDDLEVASAVCAHAALSVDNARRYMREWIIASTVQQRVLPGEPAVQPAVEVSRLHVPGPQGGGAWSDAIALPGARTALIVGDVAGEGIPAAITMGLLRTAVHTLAALDLQPDELLARLSDTTARLVAARAALPPVDPLHREPLTAGCAIAIYDPVDLTCTIARAGLPAPVAVLPDGTSVNLPVPPGPQLAARDTAPIPAATIPLPEGTTLAMGTAALAAEVLAPSGSLRPLLDGGGTGSLAELSDTIARTFTDEHRTHETLLLMARTKALPAERVLTCALPEGSEAAPIARAAARRQLELWGLSEETAFTTELIVSEFVGNAIRYGSPPLRMRLILDRTLTCEVGDTAPSAPHVKHARTVDETGRGLFIVASLAEQWGTRYQADSKIVWAEQPVRHG